MADSALVGLARWAAEVLGEASRLADRPTPIEDALRHVDPLWRGGVRRRALGAFADAMVALGARPATTAEQLRLGAWLVEHPDEVVDDGAIDRALAATAPYPKRRWWWTTIALALVACVGLGLLGDAVRRVVVHERAIDALKRRGPRPGGAWARGGKPPLAPAVADVFGRALADWAIALSVVGQDPSALVRAAGARDALLTQARAGLPPDVAARLGELIAAAELVAQTSVEVAAGGGEDEEDPQTQAFLIAVGRLDDALAAAGLGVWVDGDVLVSDARVLVVVYAFAVDEIRRFRAAGGASDGLEVAALRVRRLDTMNVRHALIGFTRPNLREAVVLLDQLDGMVAQRVLPVLAEGAPLDICGDAAEGDPAGRAALELTYGALARADLAAAGLDAGASGRVAAALRRREQALVGVRESLKRAGLSLADPDGLALAPGIYRELEGVVPAGQLDALAEADAALQGDEPAKIHAAVRAELARSVERHEVQHRLDLGAGELAMPPPLEALVGPGGVRARDELSAYLSEVARDARTPRLGIAAIGRFLCDADHWGSAESDAAIVLLEGMSVELGLGERHLVDRGIVDRAGVIDVLAGIARTPADRVRAAAKTLWERWYGKALPELSLVAGPPA